MAQGKAEDAGGLTPAKDDNTALYHFAPRTLPIFKCVDYMPYSQAFLRRKENLVSEHTTATKMRAKPASSRTVTGSP